MFNPFMTKYICLQIQVLICLNCSTLMYLINFKPFLGRTTNRLEFINEVSVLIATESLLFYTPIIIPTGQTIVGWLIIGSMFLSLLINMSIFFIESFRLVKLKIIKTYKILMFKRTSNSSNEDKTIQSKTDVDVNILHVNIAMSTSYSEGKFHVKTQNMYIA